MKENEGNLSTFFWQKSQMQSTTRILINWTTSFQCCSTCHLFGFGALVVITNSNNHHTHFSVLCYDFSTHNARMCSERSLPIHPVNTGFRKHCSSTRGARHCYEALRCRFYNNIRKKENQLKPYEKWQI